MYIADENIWRKDRDGLEGRSQPYSALLWRSKSVTMFCQIVKAQIPVHWPISLHKQATQRYLWQYDSLVLLL